MKYERIRVETTHSGSRLRLILCGGSGNVIDRAMAAEIVDVLKNRANEPEQRCITIEGEGKHFSFGASVQEHAPETAAELLHALHDIVVEIVQTNVPIVSAVHGACLGGALEMVLPSHRIIATPDSKLGLPEVTLGMYAPAGSILLPVRVRRSLADEMLITGRTLSGTEAFTEHLVDQLADDAPAAATAWFEEWLLPLSSTAIQFATRASRRQYVNGVHTCLLAEEERFVDDLMKTADAQEGVAAFMEKRQPVWTGA